MATLTAEYLDDLARIKLTAGGLDPNVIYRIDRSTDGGVTWDTVRGATNVTDGGVTIVYDYEYAPNVENRYRLVAPAISDTFERNVGPGGLVVDGTSGSYASSPDSGAIDITGNIDMKGVISFPDYSTGGTPTIFGKYVTTGSQRSYWFRVGATGTLQAVFSTTGANAITVTSTATLYSVGIADGDTVAVRVTRVAATGLVTFYVGNHPALNPGTWIQLGATVTSTSGNLFASTAPLEVGTVNNGTGDRATGTVVEIRLHNGINGSTVAGPSFAQQPTGTTAFNDFTGKSWTVNGSATIFGNDQAWGSADTGQAWTLHTDSGDYGVWEVKNGAGRVTTPASDFGQHSRYLNVNLADVEVVYDMVMPSIAGVANDEAEFSLLVRGTTDNDIGYDITIWVEASTGRATIDIGGAGSFTPVELPSWQPGQTWRVRARAVGTVIEARAWNTANPEPTTWQAVTTSMNFTTGTVGLMTLGLTNGSYTAIWDNLVVYTVPATAAATATVTPEQDDVWLKSIQFPSLNRNLGCIFTGDRSRRSRVGLFDIRGRHAVLAIFDVGSTETMAIQFITTSVAENEAVTALLTWGGPLLLQSPPDPEPDDGCGDIAAYPSGWFAPGDNTQARPLTGRRGWEWTVPLTRIALPSTTGILPAHMTWDVLWQIAATWVDVWDEWATWAELWDEAVAPGTMIDVLGS